MDSVEKGLIKTEKILEPVTVIIAGTIGCIIGIIFGAIMILIIFKLHDPRCLF